MLDRPINRRVSVSKAMSDFAGLSDTKRQALGRVAGAMQAAAYGGDAYHADIAEADFRVLEDFTDFLSGEYQLVGVIRRDTKVDEQHSPDGYSHYLDREQM